MNEELICQAQRAIDHLGEKQSYQSGLTFNYKPNHRILSEVYRCENKKKWLQCILDILKEGKYARIVNSNGQYVDVSRVAHTTVYASFFDVYNHLTWFDVNVHPVVTTELIYRLTYG